jgi:hypothetical protein
MGVGLVGGELWGLIAGSTTRLIYINGRDLSCETKISNFTYTVTKNDILWFDISMDDTSLM